MRFIHQDIPEVMIIEADVFEDERGFFFESFRKLLFESEGVSANFVQDNHSGSKQGTLRGLHYQIQQPQGKLVCVITGEIYDVAVDMRCSSKTFGQFTGQYISAQKRNQIWIPVGFAHGFYVVSEMAEVLYKVTDYYAPKWERSLLWNDPALGIPWPLINGQPPILSAKDANGKTLAKAELFE